MRTFSFPVTTNQQGTHGGQADVRRGIPRPPAHGHAEEHGPAEAKHLAQRPRSVPRDGGGDVRVHDVLRLHGLPPEAVARCADHARTSPSGAPHLGGGTVSEELELMQVAWLRDGVMSIEDMWNLFGAGVDIYSRVNAVERRCKDRWKLFEHNSMNRTRVCRRPHRSSTNARRGKRVLSRSDFP